MIFATRTHLSSPVRKRFSFRVLAAALIASLALASGRNAQAGIGASQPEFPLSADCWIEPDWADCSWVGGAVEFQPPGDQGGVVVLNGFLSELTLPGEHFHVLVEFGERYRKTTRIQTARLVRMDTGDVLPEFEFGRVGSDDPSMSDRARGEWQEFEFEALTAHRGDVEIGLVMYLVFGEDLGQEDQDDFLGDMRFAAANRSPNGVFDPNLPIVAVVDSDGDGIYNHEDNCPNSDLDRRVRVRDCTTSVANDLLPGGCTINDLIQNREQSAVSLEDFRDQLNLLLDHLILNGHITQAERAEILSCLEQVSFTLEFGRPFADSHVGTAGSVSTGTVRSVLTTADNTNPEGAQGWSISVRAVNAQISSITVDDTAGDLVSNGGYRDGGFEFSEVINGGAGALSALVLSIALPNTLPPNGTETVALMDVSVVHPEAGSCEPVRLIYLDGQQGSGDPVDNLVVFQDASVTPTLVNDGFQVCGSTSNWVTYDANGDAAMNMADGVAHLASLFTGGPSPLCEEAMDFNGDSQLNIADPVGLFSYLFLGGPQPVDGLGCNDYPTCRVSCQ